MSASSTSQSLLPYAVLMVIIFNIQAQNTQTLGLIVPNIAQRYFKLNPQGNSYTLRVSLPDGSSRTEVVELINPGAEQQFLSVKGTTYQLFTGASDKTTYTADKNGYVVKYIYGADTDKIIEFPQIGVLALKTAAG